MSLHGKLGTAKTLMKKHNVRAIIGLGTWQEASLVAELGNKSKVPFFSLVNDQYPRWASYHLPFFVSAAPSQLAQMKAIASIIKTWEWRKVTLIYEDIDSVVTNIIPSLFSALQQADSEIGELVPLPPFPHSHSSIVQNLERLKNGQCRVFIVHASTKLGANIFIEAKKMGMMEKEYVWITTNSITDYIDSLNASVISSMQGVIGVMSYFNHSSKKFRDFQSRFQDIFRAKFPKETNLEPGISALQAYDAVWAILFALEEEMTSDNVDALVSSDGKKLLDKILTINFKGLSGLFQFKHKQLPCARVFRIVNVAGTGYRKLGYWSDELGFSKSIGKGSKYNISMGILGSVLWPGGPWSVPRGWAVTTSAQKIKIGVPAKCTFSEFVNVKYDSRGHPIVRGFSIDVFNATLQNLPYDLPCEFVPLEGTYDSLVEKVHLKSLDAFIGDVTILANRSQYVEFSQPYSESGIQLLVYVKPTIMKRPWLFKKPFTSHMWITTGLINIYNGFVVWLIERNQHPEFRGSIWNQIGTMLSLAFTTLFSLQGERLHNNLARMVMVVWLFVALLITQSFTASLTSLLTVDRLEPTKTDIETLRRSGAKIGCSGRSFVVNYLQEVLDFKPYNIKKIYSEDEYSQALVSGEIAAAFLEVPYIKLFLAKHCKGFTTAGSIYKVGGFGFAFPRSSPYLPDISRAVLKVSESGKLLDLEKSLISPRKCLATSEDNQGSLGLNSFWGLFLITGGTTTIALVSFIFRQFHQRGFRRFSQMQQQHESYHDELLMFAPEMAYYNHRT